MMGIEPPDIVKNVPTVDEFSQFYIDAFWELSTHRSIAFSVGPIPILTIVEYGKYLRLSEYELHEFKYLIRAMDMEFLRIQNEKK